MEKRPDPSSPDPSEDDGESLSPRLPSPPLLPLQVAHQDHRTTNFFIDNILRPDFGCRKDQGPDEPQQTNPSIRGGRAHRPIQPRTPCQDFSCYTDSNSSSTSSTVPSPSGARESTVDNASGATTPKYGGDKMQAAFPNTREASFNKELQPLMWPAWVYCTRYSDRPSSVFTLGPRTRKLKTKKTQTEDKRPRTAFTAEQLQRLKTEFQLNRYITEQRRQDLANELNLNESQIKIWFQNKRAKIKKSTGYKNSLALHLMAQGLYNHSTTTVQDKEESD